MRRLALALSFLAGMVLSSPAANAAGTPAFRGHALSQVGDLHNLGPARQTVQSGAITNATQLKEPTSVFPSDFTITLNEPQNANGVDDPNQTDLGFVHNVVDQTLGNGVKFSYKDDGMLFGWLEYADKTLADGSTWRLEYLATAYNNPDSATNTFNGLVDYYNTLGQYISGTTSSVCSFPGATQCVDVYVPSVFTIGGFPFDGVIRFLVKSNAVWEGGYFIYDGDLAANRSAGTTYLTNMANGFIADFNAPSPTPNPTSTPPPPVTTPTPKPLPSPPPGPRPTPVTTPPTTQLSFHLIKVQFEKVSKNPRETDHALKKAKLGSKVMLAGYLEVDSAPAGLPVSVDLKITKGGKNIAHGTFSGNLDSSSPTGIYPLAENWKIPKSLRTGTYTGTIAVTMSGQSAKASGHLKVVKH